MDTLSRHTYPPVIYFAPDCTDSAVRKRVGGLRELGCDVTTVSFRRVRYNRDYQPNWRNIDLGVIRDKSYARRVFKAAASLLSSVRAVRRSDASAIILARNLDMALLAIISMKIARNRLPLGYEVLDVLYALYSDSLRGRLLRAVERFVLSRTAILVVSSPRYITEHFYAKQRYDGDWQLLENKLHVASRERPSEPADPEGFGRDQTRPWRLVWLGTLRCERSFRILECVADALAGKIEIHLWGYPTRLGMDRLRRCTETHANISYLGEYSHADLATIYSEADFGWCFDYSDPWGLSDWLLSNRVYEAGYYDCPTLASISQETGKFVCETGSGWTFEEPVDAALISFLEGLTAAEYTEKKKHILSLSKERFCSVRELGEVVWSIDSARARIT